MSAVKRMLPRLSHEAASVYKTSCTSRLSGGRIDKNLRAPPLETPLVLQPQFFPSF